MKVIFISNYFNHHQKPFCDEMYNLLGAGNFFFISTTGIPEFRKELGYKEMSTEYTLNCSPDLVDMIIEADVVIIGSAPNIYIKERLIRNKLTFRYSERWFKDGYYHLLSPRALMGYYNTHTKWRNHNLYMLSASAYTANDAATIFAYPDKCFKWGYFTAVPELDIESIVRAKRASTVKILWVARFLQLKHPERMLQLATLLRKAGYDDFVIDMVGSGEKFDEIKALITEQGLDNHISLLGNFPNEHVHNLMREHHIFCFTSDKNEGWGAVLNESMSNGCAVVASHAIGSVPFLIKNGENGFVYNSDSVHDLFKKVKFLIDNPDQRESLSIAAYHTMHEEWSPQKAAANFLQLAESLLNGRPIEIPDGPCSKAEPTRKNFYKI